jgi:hypothetical protein
MMVEIWDAEIRLALTMRGNAKDNELATLEVLETVVLEGYKNIQLRLPRYSAFMVDPSNPIDLACGPTHSPARRRGGPHASTGDNG